MSLVLNKNELEQYTGRVQRRSQRRVLDAMGIPYELRPDATIVVLRSSIEREAANTPEQTTEPNWSALDNG